LKCQENLRLVKIQEDNSLHHIKNEHSVYALDKNPFDQLDKILHR
jgi:hypothetical protein